MRGYGLFRRCWFLLGGLATGMFAAAPGAAHASEDALMARGAYLARAADCVACHTRPGGPVFGGGYGIQSPMGVIYSSNITPSIRYGIGRWSEAGFARAVREGLSSDGRHLYPAMPYDSYSGLTDRDIHALYVYMRQGVAAVEQPVGAETRLRFPYNFRGLMGVWNWLFLDRTRFAPRPAETERAARGRYLVETVAHCGTCHTPRNFMMAAKRGKALSGARVGGWFAPDIAAGRNGPLASWRDEEIDAYLRNGHVRDRAVAAGPMGEAVEHSLRYLTDDDLAAITHYLRRIDRSGSGAIPVEPRRKTISGEREYGFSSAGSEAVLAMARRERAANPGPYADRRDYRSVAGGAALYRAACASCHQLDGSGTQDDYYPALRESTILRGGKPDNLVMTILAGVHRNGADGLAAMPAFRQDLSDAQIVAIVRFLSRTFGGREMAVDSAQIAALRRLDTADFAAQALPSGSRALNTRPERP